MVLASRNYKYSSPRQCRTTSMFTGIYLPDLDFPDPDLPLLWLLASFALHSIACSLYEARFITAPQTERIQRQVNTGVSETVARVDYSPSQFVDCPLVLFLSFFLRKNNEPRFLRFSGKSISL